MNHTKRSNTVGLPRAGRFGWAVVLCSALVLVFAAPAMATYEHVKTFGDSGEGALQSFGGPGASAAINTTGAGGVPVGTVYVATAQTPRVMRYSATGEFREAWGWGVAKHPAGELPAEEFQRCGSDGEPAFPECGTDASSGEGEGQFWEIKGIAVDQSTGNVYVYSVRHTHGAIEVFSADGSELIARFGDFTAAESFDESPEDIHGSHFETPIQVDEAGNVYLLDQGVHLGTITMRVMTFKPASPGDYAHYVYAGRSGDLEIDVNRYGFIEHTAIDQQGDLFISGANKIFQFTAGQLSNPVCQFLVPGGGAYGMTVNPENGEVFYFSYKNRKIHQLAPCNANHVFTEIAEFPAARKTEEIYTLAFDGAIAFDPSRPVGILYAFDAQLTTEAEIFAPAEARAPVIDDESVSGVRSTNASLNAQINPKGSQTRYVFQYLTATAYEANDPAERFAGATEAPLGGAVLGSGQAALTAQVGLSGLLPETEYRYRVVASSNCDPEHEAELCLATGEAASFRTYPEASAGLPDHRVYELVSPALKGSGEVFPLLGSRGTCKPLESECKPGGQSENYPRQVSPDGESVVYEGHPFTTRGGAVRLNEYLSKRTSTGWTTVNLTPETLGGQLPNGYKAFNSTLTEGALLQDSPTLTPSAPAGYQNLYLQPSGSPFSLTPLLEVAPPNRGPEGQSGLAVAYGGASEDFSRFFFAANDALTEATQDAPVPQDSGSQSFNLYEEREGDLQLVNVLPGNTESSPGASFGAGGIEAGFSLSERGVSNVSRFLSVDGSRVFWSSATGQVFVREDASTTREVSESQRATPDPVGAQPAKFLTASPDGSRALFSSSEEMTDDADTGSIEQTIHVQATAGTFVLAFKGQKTPPLPFNAGGVGVQQALEGLVSIGPSNVEVDTLGGEYRVRFIGSLAGNEDLLAVDGAGLTGSVTSSATRSGKNLYEWHNGVITDLTPDQTKGTFLGLVGQSDDLSSVYFVDSSVLAENENARGDGAKQGGNNLYLEKEGQTSFIATLVGADNSVDLYFGDWQDAPLNRTAEASSDGSWLAFISENPLTGVDSAGSREVFLYDADSGHLSCPSCNPTGTAPLGSSFLPIRKMSSSMANGAQPQYLTDSGRLYFDSRDALTPFDTNDGVEDVYEYEPNGLGSCAREGGCVNLISAGTSTVDSNFLAVDPTGRNVFFTTRDRLSPRDRDESIDLYDAREDGGIAAEGEVPRSECQGEACQPLPITPDDPTPTSANFQGAGNVVTADHEKRHKAKHKKKHRKKHDAKRAAGRKHGGAK